MERAGHKAEMSRPPNARDDYLLRANIARLLEHQDGVHHVDAPLAGATPLDRLQRSNRNVPSTSRHKGIRLSSSPPTNAQAADGAADRRIGSPQLPGHDRPCGTIRSIDLAEPAALATSTR
jgi:hypothetical protein